MVSNQTIFWSNRKHWPTIRISNSRWNRRAGPNWLYLEVAFHCSGFQSLTYTRLPPSSSSTELLENEIPCARARCKIANTDQHCQKGKTPSCLNLGLCVRVPFVVAMTSLVLHKMYGSATRSPDSPASPASHCLEQGDQHSSSQEPTDQQRMSGALHWERLPLGSAGNSSLINEKFPLCMLKEQCM